MTRHSLDIHPNERDILRQNSAKKFFAYIEKHGGLFDKSQALLFSGMTENVFDLLISERKILRLVFEGKEFFPTFQFSENRDGTIIQDVLPYVPDHIGPAHICSFLLHVFESPRASGGCLSYVDILKNSPSQQDLSIIQNAAATLGFMGR